MRFEYVILLILAFNVVTALMQRRAKKARQRAAEEGSAGRSGSGTVPRPRPEPVIEENGFEGDGREVRHMPGLGRDILDQLARDLGMKLPPPPRARPQPAETAPPRVGTGIPATAQSRNPRLYTETMVPGKPLIPSRDTAPTATTARPRSLVGNAHPPSPTFSMPRVLGMNLRNPKYLREAIVLREILDPPVSRRRRATR